MGGAGGKDEVAQGGGGLSREGFGLYPESYGHAMVFVHELSSKGKSKNNRPGNEN